MNYLKNDPNYICHLEILTFSAVTYVDKGAPFNRLGECHRNCENYKNRHGGELVFGWLLQNYYGKSRYLLHSCLIENGSLINITPPALICPTNLFAQDSKIILDPNVTQIFRFLDYTNNRELPKYFEKPF